jgi:hypothetical protein
MFGLDADTLRNIKKVFAALPNLEKVILNKKFSPLVKYA